MCVLLQVPAEPSSSRPSGRAVDDDGGRGGLHDARRRLPDRPARGAPARGGLRRPHPHGRGARRAVAQRREGADGRHLLQEQDAHGTHYARNAGELLTLCSSYKLVVIAV